MKTKSSIYRENNSCNKGGCIACQKEDCSYKFIRNSKSSHGCVLNNQLAPFGGRAVLIR